MGVVFTIRLVSFILLQAMAPWVLLPVCFWGRREYEAISRRYAVMG